jgi:uncharacterized protein
MKEKTQSPAEAVALVKRRIALAAPIALVPVMYAVFQLGAALLGYPAGYLAAFVIYWLGWGVVFPFFVLGGRRGVSCVFGAGDPRLAELGWKMQFLLWWPLVFPLAFAFLRRLQALNLPIAFVSILLGFVTGITEELLWRGVYISLFPENLWWGVVYPSVVFGLWHVCPQSVRPSTMPGGAVSFVIYALLLGLSYAAYARRTRSIRWCAVSHCMHDALGLGGLAYVGWFR